MRKLLDRLFWLLVLGAVVALAIWGPEDGGDGSPARPGRASRAFEALSGCRVVDHRDNDGDSFHLAHDGRENEFRLYFVDCPEKRLHQFNGDRLQEQGRYFGGLSVEETLRVGSEARARVDELLRTRPFTVHTRWAPVFDSGRFYAFVFIEHEGGGQEELSEILVREGLCRIHTEGSALPDGRSEREFAARLRALERDARSRRAGAWR
jgi:endonuclease YncB( thermonuclease family)